MIHRSDRDMLANYFESILDDYFFINAQKRIMDNDFDATLRARINKIQLYSHTNQFQSNISLFGVTSSILLLILPNCADRFLSRFIAWRMKRKIDLYYMISIEDFDCYFRPSLISIPSVLEMSCNKDSYLSNRDSLLQKANRCNSRESKRAMRELSRLPEWPNNQTNIYYEKRPDNISCHPDSAVNSIARWWWTNIDTGAFDVIMGDCLPDNVIPLLRRCRDFLRSDIEFYNEQTHSNEDELFFAWEHAKHKYKDDPEWFRCNCRWPVKGDNSWPFPPGWNAGDQI